MIAGSDLAIQKPLNHNKVNFEMVQTEHFSSVKSQVGVTWNRPRAERRSGFRACFSQKVAGS
jgi:hypothetical protein